MLQQTTPIHEIRVAILELLAGGYPKLAQVAEQVDMAPRTLQRRLATLGTSYTELVNDLRFDLAAKLLRDQEMKISKVASELGFANHSGFCRAFNSWSGMTPRQYRVQFSGHEPTADTETDPSLRAEPVSPQHRHQSPR